MLSIEDRLISIERDVNRIMEILLSLTSVDEVKQFTDIHDSESTSLTNRIARLETIVVALRTKLQLIPTSFE